MPPPPTATSSEQPDEVTPAAQVVESVEGIEVTGWRTELLVAMVMVVLSLAFVGVRLANHDMDPTVFSLAGDLVTDPEANPDMFIVEDAYGYDGQRYYRLARNPFPSDVEEFGITFDRPAYWQKRIGYPFIVWLASGFGQKSVVPWMMIGVNIAAVGVIAAIGARLARMFGRSPWLGLVPAAWAGHLIAIAHNLTEPVVGAFLAAALLLIRRQRWLPATACLVAAALTRETSLVFSVALLAVAFSPIARNIVAAKTSDGSPVKSPRIPVWVPITPIITYIAWRALINNKWAGAIEGGTEDDALLGLPFVRLFEFFGTVIEDPGSAALMNLAQLGLTIAAVVLLVLTWFDRRSGLPQERLAIVLLLALFVCLPVWHRGQAYLRWACEPVLIGWVIALGARTSRVRLLAAAVAALWLLTAFDLVPFPDPDLGVDRPQAISAPGSAPAGDL